ncbi:MAG: DUF1080 domain-containing protein [Verrucomicrobiota bacterium]|nr:DUF1080 domain-containing protein [Verrucomicrobiota bacterium]
MPATAGRDARAPDPNASNPPNKPAANFLSMSMSAKPLLLLGALICGSALFAPGAPWKPHDPARPRPRVITPPGMSTPQAAGQPPSDAIVLFDGKDLSKWKRDKRKDDTEPADDRVLWKVENGYMEIAPKSGSIRTREKIKGDTQWHIEWATPAEVKGKGQGRGNSGVFIGGFPEVQVLDSFDNDTYPDGQAAGLYGHHPPLVNASRKPGEWQTYDIFVERQKKDEKGSVSKKARLTVLHNGIAVHWGREFESAVQEGDLQLQDHGNPVRYRNIWVRRINLTDPDSEGTPPPAK